uniref:Uncharacterized protein n=1 Tax=Physcomitrium patens TaxID=3218 RepID=A0A2K1IYP8_PHYPA|nr:hypothetical protein PHYPA_024212 [Physcomitrium patens]
MLACVRTPEPIGEQKSDGPKNWMKAAKQVQSNERNKVGAKNISEAFVKRKTE